MTRSNGGHEVHEGIGGRKFLPEIYFVYFAYLVAFVSSGRALTRARL